MTMSLIRSNRRPRRGLLAVTAAGALLLASACSSDDAGDDDDPPAVEGTVVPPDPNGVGGGVPVDNLNPDVADQSFQTVDDVDGDADPEP